MKSTYGGRGTPGTGQQFSLLPITCEAKKKRELMMTTGGDAALLDGIMLVRRRAYEGI